MQTLIAGKNLLLSTSLSFLAILFHSIQNNLCCVTKYCIISWKKKIFVNFRYFSELELNYTRKNLERTKDAIVRLSPKHPEGPESASWPIGEYKEPTTYQIFLFSFISASNFKNLNFSFEKTLK